MECSKPKPQVAAPTPEGPRPASAAAAAEAAEAASDAMDEGEEEREEEVEEQEGEEGDVEVDDDDDDFDSEEQEGEGRGEKRRRTPEKCVANRSVARIDSIMGEVGVASKVLSFVPSDLYLFVSGVCCLWRNIWRELVQARRLTPEQAAAAEEAAVEAKWCRKPKEHKGDDELVPPLLRPLEPKKYSYEGPPLYRTSLQAALSSPTCFRWALDCGLKWQKRMAIITAREPDGLKVLQYAWRKRFIKVITSFHRRRPMGCELVCAAAAGAGHLETLKQCHDVSSFTIESGIPACGIYTAGSAVAPAAVVSVVSTMSAGSGSAAVQKWTAGAAAERRRGQEEGRQSGGRRGNGSKSCGYL